MKRLHIKTTILIGIVLLSVSACNSSTTNQKQNESTSSQQLHLKFSDKTSMFHQGDRIRLEYVFSDSSLPDSLTLLVDNKGKSFQEENNILSILSDSLTIGRHSISITAYAGDVALQKNLSFTLLPDKAPIERGYKIKNTYPHDIHAYTQGLEFISDLYMYESTGLRGKSSLRKVNFKTGEIIQKTDLERQFFGEGIAVIGEKLYQLTWQSQIGFVWDKESFQKISSFTYPTEGWGLCFDGEYLRMSDGSHFIYTISPDNFSIVSKIEVYTNNGPVLYLNELEYIEGFIYANVYQTDKVVKVDPKTGAVLEIIDFSGLLQPNDILPATDVLNGIAYDAATKKMYVTGKNWPKLFEVEIL